MSSKEEGKSMAEQKFAPNSMSLAACLELVEAAVAKAGFQAEGRIVTSRDEGIEDLRAALATDNVPDGFRKWQLPVYLRSASTLFVTVAEPGAYAPPHAHDEGDGIRFIAGGSITYDEKELTQGDWMFIPAGAQYSFQVGPFGAIMCYCYCCCCA
jgi:hypothetical protein